MVNLKNYYNRRDLLVAEKEETKKNWINNKVNWQQAQNKQDLEEGEKTKLCLF